MFAIAIYLFYGAMIAIPVVMMSGLALESWRHASPIGRGVGLAVGAVGVCPTAVHFLVHHDLTEAVVLGPPWMLVLLGTLAMRLVTWRERRKVA